LPQDLNLVLVAHRHGLHPLHGRRSGHERPVDRERIRLIPSFITQHKSAGLEKLQLVGTQK
jgi:hypothetical protein